MSFLLRPAAVLTLAAAVLLSACGGSSSGPDRSAFLDPGASATPQSQVLAAQATAVTLPLTPQARSYVLPDPSFQALPGARAFFGTENSAAWQAEVPDDWNGELVLFAHGYRDHLPDLAVEPPPLRDHLIASGFAWAASSYRSNGYIPGIAAEDTLALRGIFTRVVGRAPTRLYLYGQSMGGNVVTYSLERYPDAYDGALAECGSLDAADELGYFVDWAAVSAYLAGANDAAIASNPARFAQVEITAHQVLGSPGHYTLQGRQFRSVMINRGGGPRPWAEEGFDLQYPLSMGLLADALVHPDTSTVAGGNEGVVYSSDPSLGLDDAALNAGAIRIAPNPAAPAGDPALAHVSGDISHPLLTLHGTGDLFVPISLEQNYRRRVEAAGHGDLLVQRAVRRPGHCNFSDDERQHAFDDLVRWVRDGTRPAGDDLLGAPLSQAGLQFTEPLLAGDPGPQSP